MSHDPLDIQGQELSREEAQEKSRVAARIEADDVKWLMANKRGRRIVYRLLSSAGVWRPSFNTNALQMAHNEGRRFEGLELLKLLMANCPERYDEMIKEHLQNG